MSFFTRNPHGNRNYTVFSAGAEAEYSLGYEEKPNIPNIKKALDYVKKRNSHYSEVEEKLVSMLPPVERDRYISKQIREIRQKENQYVSSLSDLDLKKQLKR